MGESDQPKTPLAAGLAKEAQRRFWRTPFGLFVAVLIAAAVVYGVSFLKTKGERDAQDHSQPYDQPSFSNPPLDSKAPGTAAPRDDISARKPVPSPSQGNDQDLERWVRTHLPSFSLRETLESIDEARTAADLLTIATPIMTALQSIEDDSPKAEQDMKQSLCLRLFPLDKVFGPFLVDTQPASPAAPPFGAPFGAQPGLRAIERHTGLEIWIQSGIGLGQFTAKQGLQLRGSVTGFGPSTLMITNARLE